MDAPAGARQGVRWPIGKGLRLVGPVAIWAASFVLLMPYVLLRGVGDEFFAPHDIQHLEERLFGTVPTIALQDRFFSTGHGALDQFGFLMHLSWFFLPFCWGIVVAVTDRSRLMEFFGWVLAISYLSTLFFFAVPVRPPWMEEGVYRVLVEGRFGDYTKVDDNPFAAFPSLHAALPIAIALFLWFRLPAKRGYAVLAALHGLLIGFSVVYLGEHWLIDVVGGWALAGVTAWLFVSPRCRAVFQALPGRPLARMGRLNDWIMGLGKAEERPAPLSLPEPVREAA